MKETLMPRRSGHQTPGLTYVSERHNRTQVEQHRCPWTEEIACGCLLFGKLLRDSNETCCKFTHCFPNHNANDNSSAWDVRGRRCVCCGRHTHPEQLQFLPTWDSDLFSSDHVDLEPTNSNRSNVTRANLCAISALPQIQNANMLNVGKDQGLHSSV